MAKKSTIVLEEFNIDELNKNTDTIMIRFSTNMESEYFVYPELLGKFVKIIRDNGYNAIAIPIESDVEIKKGE